MYQLVIKETFELIASAQAEEVVNYALELLQKDAKEAKHSIPELAIYTEDGICIRTIAKKTLLEDADLSVRTYNCLKRYGLTYFEEIKGLSIAEILNIRNIGKRCCAEILRKVAYEMDGIQ